MKLLFVVMASALRSKTNDRQGLVCSRPPQADVEFRITKTQQKYRRKKIGCSSASMGLAVVWRRGNGNSQQYFPNLIVVQTSFAIPG
jgi:hypothetical protein